MSYDNLPILNVDMLMPRRIRYRLVGDGFEGGRNGNNEPQAISLDGGGRVVATFEDCQIQTRQQHRYLNELEARLSGSFRYILVPIITDWIGPFPLQRGIPQPYTTRLFDADNSMIDGATSALTATVTATLAEAAVTNAGVVKITLSAGAPALAVSGWFSVSHGGGRGNRAYRIWDILSVVGQTYEVAISPPFRRLQNPGQAVRIVRPLFTARYPAGFTAGWESEGWWQSRPTFEFSEAP